MSQVAQRLRARIKETCDALMKVGGFAKGIKGPDHVFVIIAVQESFHRATVLFDEFEVDGSGVYTVIHPIPPKKKVPIRPVTFSCLLCPYRVRSCYVYA